MDDRTMPSTFADLIATRFLPRDLTRNDSHIVDQLIAETAYLAQHVFIPVRRRATAVAARAASSGSPPSAPPRPPA